MSTSPRIRIGTRGSKLARWQCDWVAAQLQKAGAAVEVIEIVTTGDVIQREPLADVGGMGLFTKEIQTALLAGQVDVAVHSLKDLPTQSVDELQIAAVPLRENPVDALVSMATSLAELPPSARVGTGSVRRQAQLLHLRPDLQLHPIRGNVDTRLRKLDAGEFDAIVLAAAGLVRLGLSDRIAELLAPPRMLPAPGQGALAIECRAADTVTLQIVAPLDDLESRLGVAAERAALAALEGGCSAPFAAWGRMIGQRLQLDALVADIMGKHVLRASGAIELAEYAGRLPVTASAESLGRIVADDLLAQGAADLMSAARDD